MTIAHCAPAGSGRRKFEHAGFEALMGCWSLVLTVLVLVVGGCAGAARTVPPPIDPRSFTDMGTVAWDFEWRQAITADYTRPDGGGKRENASFEAVLQKQGGTLTLVGLTPFGTRAFVAHQKGRSVTLAEGQASSLPFPAEFIFLDVNRCFFLGLSRKSRPDGWHEQRIGDEIVRDQWEKGRVVQRLLRNAKARDEKLITIRYRPGFMQGRAPAEIELVNQHFNYRLRIRTLDAGSER